MASWLMRTRPRRTSKASSFEGPRLRPVKSPRLRPGLGKNERLKSDRVPECNQLDAADVESKLAKDIAPAKCKHRQGECREWAGDCKNEPHAAV